MVLPHPGFLVQEEIPSIVFQPIEASAIVQFALSPQLAATWRLRKFRTPGQLPGL
jgi:hypothetical protein